MDANVIKLKKERKKKRKKERKKKKKRRRRRRRRKEYCMQDISVIVTAFKFLEKKLKYLQYKCT